MTTTDENEAIKPGDQSLKISNGQPGTPHQSGHYINKLSRRIFRSGLTRSLLLWFLLLALMPLVVVSLISYQQSRESLYAGAARP